LESFGLVPLEAMASGAIVAGFHGYGGRNMLSDNGFWFPPIIWRKWRMRSRELLPP